jgi:hypothetical protein
VFFYIIAPKKGDRMWFNVDKAGLAALLERRRKSFALFELVQNAWDAGASEVNVTLEAIGGAPFVRIVVEDNATEGWADLSDAFTMFKRSSRGGDLMKRGRFCLGEKLVLALCRKAQIVTPSGAVLFDESGRRRAAYHRERGTLFEGEIRMTRAELAEVEADAMRLISPPLTTTLLNGQAIPRPVVLKRFEARLPTEVADEEGKLCRSTKTATVEAFASTDGVGEILELGIPVCSAEWPWRLNVEQKVPLGMERETASDAFRRALQVAALNALADTLDEEQSAQPWVSEAMGDARVAPNALEHIVTARFGKRAVVAVPGDPIANATAEAMGSTVIHGGSLSAGAWANVRKHALLPTTSEAFPTPKPDHSAKSAQICPLCKQPVK